MLLFDDSKKLEKALGEEAAAVIAHVFEKADENWRQELATKADLHIGLQTVKVELREEISAVRAEVQAVRVEIQASENRLLRWMVGGFIAQTALLVAILAFLR